MTSLKQFVLRWTLPLAILAFLMPNLVKAQVNEGSIIKSISLKPQGADYMLQIKGILNAKQLSKIKIRQKPNSNKLTLEFPDTLVDPESLPSSFLNFKAEDPIENIKLVESLKKVSESEVSFNLDLVIEGKKALKPEIIKPISKGSINILLKDYEKVMAAIAAQSQGTKARRNQPERFTKARLKQLEAQKREVAKKAQTTNREFVKQYRKPALMQISILNGTGYPKRAYQLSVFLGNLQKRRLEESLGMKLDIVNIANTPRERAIDTTIYYRDNYLKSALSLATLIDGEQRIVPMLGQSERVGVDIEIYLGKDYK